MIWYGPNPGKDHTLARTVLWQGSYAGKEHTLARCHTLKRTIPWEGPYSDKDHTLGRAIPWEGPYPAEVASWDRAAHPDTVRPASPARGHCGRHRQLRLAHRQRMGKARPLRPVSTPKACMQPLPPPAQEPQTRCLVKHDHTSSGLQSDQEPPLQENLSV